MMIHDIERPFKSEEGRDGRCAFVPKPMREAGRWAVAGPDKVPHDAKTGRRASSNDPTTWASFEDARAALDDGRYDRLYFASGEGFGFVDFDGVIIDGEIHPDVRAAVDAADSYAEVSPSGNGVHIWATTPDAAQPWKKHNATPWGGHIEVYKAGQFGSVTGHVLHDAPLNGNGTIDGVMARFPRPDASTGLTAPDAPVSPPMTDDEVIRRLRGDKHAAEFSELYDTPPSPNEDASSGDQSLFSRIAFYTQDREQIERIALDSARVRDKWGRPDYIARTIEKALKRSDFWQPSGTVARLKIGGKDATTVLDARRHDAPDPFAFFDLSTAPTEPPEALVPGLIIRGLVHSVYAAAGTGKTWTALYAVHQTVARGEKVVYVDKENGPRIMRQRLDLMGVDPDARDNLIRYAPFPSAGLDAPTVDAWAAMLDREAPALVVFDSWVGFLAACGMDENSSVDIAAWSEAYATPARSRGIAVLILDHVPKADSKSARGSGRKLDYVDVQYEQTATPFDRHTVGLITLKKRKDREACLPGSQAFRVGGTPGGIDGTRLVRPGFVFEPVDAPHDPAGDGVKAGERATLGALKDGMTYAEWFDAAGRSNSTFNRHRVALMDGGHVIHDEGTGTYSHPLPKHSHGSNGSMSQDRPDYSHYSHHPKGGSSGSTDGGAVDDSTPASPRSDTGGNSASETQADRTGADAEIDRVAGYLDEHERAALGILREIGSADELSWRYECHDRGYQFGQEEFREIVEELVADELVRVHYEDSAIVEERYDEDPDAWGDDYPENPPIYEAVDV
jgi:Fe2+ transport system protein FeoA